ncbi:hypothetical protein ACFLQR_04220, partial [Verrucomicrobiota bacterium]
AESSGRDKVVAALKAIKNNPLLDQGRVMENAHSFLVSITGGPDLSLEEVKQIMSGILSFAHEREDALIKTGVSCEQGWKDKVFVTILVSEKEQDQDSGRLEPGQQADGEGEVHGSRQSGTKGADGTAGKSGKGRKRAQKTKLMQASLFDSAKLGRFKEVDPTIVGGNNLDTPTYIRRGILIQKPRTTTL